MGDEDEIIKRRLLFDGDGTGEEKKTNLLLKKFYEWCNYDPKSEEGISAYNQVLGMLAQCEFSYSKSRCIRQMTDSECENYENIKKETLKDLEHAEEDLTKISEECKKANDYRKNNLEYEAIAKNIKKHPDRKQTQRRLYKLHGDIYAYKEKLEKLEQKLEKRRKQVRIVMNSLQQLQHSVEVGDLEDVEKSQLAKTKTELKQAKLGKQQTEAHRKAKSKSPLSSAPPAIAGSASAATTPPTQEQTS